MIKKEIKVLDTITTPLEIAQHASVNFLYGLLLNLSFSRGNGFKYVT